MNIANEVEKAHIMAKHTAIKEQTAIVNLLPSLFQMKEKKNKTNYNLYKIQIKY